eukprot:scaffold92686_cov36-Phaeocystis_antarctica.AAC.1
MADLNERHALPTRSLQRTRHRTPRARHGHSTPRSGGAEQIERCSVTGRERCAYSLGCTQQGWVRVRAVSGLVYHLDVSSQFGAINTLYTPDQRLQSRTIGLYVYQSLQQLKESSSPDASHGSCHGSQAANAVAECLRVVSPPDLQAPANESATGRKSSLLSALATK